MQQSPPRSFILSRKRRQERSDEFIDVENAPTDLGQSSAKAIRYACQAIMHSCTLKEKVRDGIKMDRTRPSWPSVHRHHRGPQWN